MDSQPQTIFVTGGTGFIGSHVTEELLRQGYRVLCAARASPKTTNFKNHYSKISEENRFQLVEIPDITTAQLQDVFREVDAVIHLASPPGRATAEQIYEGAVEGTLNLLKQAEKAGVRRVVITGMIQTGKLERHLETREEVLQCTDPFTIYESCKVISEKAVWEWAATHPQVDITYVTLPLTYGPHAASSHFPSPAFPGVNTYIYHLIVPDGAYPSTGYYVDVRDAAKAHVLALKSPLVSSPTEKKQITFVSPEVVDPGRAVSLLAEKRPALKDRLIRGEPPVLDEKPLACDFGKIQAILGFSKADFTSFETTILDTIDDYVEIESRWIKDGYTTFTIPHYG
ncbi:hypothetical protein V5O48_000884 [Marasmius crinis-equi]|uniref:NAD-dependent epimerase/dehydratase domain-containing protein n=1 Tax=Marasmius crinis-equi TaxID=585013 RepID=A0ABR3FZX4_9AGAR